MSRKPIFIIELPNILTIDELNDIRKSSILDEIKKEYHIVIIADDVKENKFHLLSENYIPSEDLDDLIDKIKKQIV